MSPRVLRRALTIALTLLVSFALQLSAYRALRCQRAEVLVRATTTEVSGDHTATEQAADLDDAALCAPAFALLPAWPAVRGPALESELETWALHAPEHRRRARLDRPPRAA